MPRKARRESATKTYHVMARGLNKMPVFDEKREKTRIKNLIRENLSEFDVIIYAYCIMPNHLHLLIKGDLSELVSYMAKIQARYAFYFNKKHERIGYVFQDRFKSQCVEQESYFWNCMRYIHRNPAKGGTVQDMLLYPYSSLSELYYECPDISSDKTILKISERFNNQQNFLDFHNMHSWDLFDDVEEDICTNQLQIAKDILAAEKKKYDTTTEELFDYIDTRNEFIKELQSVLKVSNKKATSIIKIIQEEQKGTG